MIQSFKKRGLGHKDCEVRSFFATRTKVSLGITWKIQIFVMFHRVWSSPMWDRGRNEKPVMCVFSLTAPKKNITQCSQTTFALTWIPGFKVFLLILHDTSYTNRIDCYLFSTYFDAHAISLLKKKYLNSSIDVINHTENNKHVSLVAVPSEKQNCCGKECYISVGQWKLVWPRVVQFLNAKFAAGPLKNMSLDP